MYESQKSHVRGMQIQRRNSAVRYRDPRVAEDVLRRVASLGVDLQHLSDQLLRQDTFKTH